MIRLELHLRHSRIIVQLKNNEIVYFNLTDLHCATR